MSGTQKMTNAQAVTAENSVQLINTQELSQKQEIIVSLVFSTKATVFLPVSQNSLFPSHSLRTF